MSDLKSGSLCHQLYKALMTSSVHLDIDAERVNGTIVVFTETFATFPSHLRHQTHPDARLHRCRVIEHVLVEFIPIIGVIG